MSKEKTCKVCGRAHYRRSEFCCSYCSSKHSVGFDTSKPKKETRKCNTCGKPTSDWRCEDCWKKIRNSTLTINVDESFIYN